MCGGVCGGECVEVSVWRCECVEVSVWRQERIGGSMHSWWRQCNVLVPADFNSLEVACTMEYVKLHKCMAGCSPVTWLGCVLQLAQPVYMKPFLYQN